MAGLMAEWPGSLPEDCGPSHCEKDPQIPAYPLLTDHFQPWFLPNPDVAEKSPGVRCHPTRLHGDGSDGADLSKSGGVCDEASSDSGVPEVLE